jgi:hypothetical protein
VVVLQVQMPSARDTAGIQLARSRRLFTSDLTFQIIMSLRGLECAAYKCVLVTQGFVSSVKSSVRGLARSD